MFAFCMSFYSILADGVVIIVAISVRCLRYMWTLSGLITSNFLFILLQSFSHFSFSIFGCYQKQRNSFHVCFSVCWFVFVSLILSLFPYQHIIYFFLLFEFRWCDACAKGTLKHHQPLYVHTTHILWDDRNRQILIKRIASVVT